jgi:hypothetical protein
LVPPAARGGCASPTTASTAGADAPAAPAFCERRMLLAHLLLCMSHAPAFAVAFLAFER